MRLVLWRHGRTSWNDEGRFQGHTDIPLDETGLRQAAVAAPMIRALRPSVIVSSDLRRCKQTAAALDLPFRTDPRLREIDLGTWSGMTGAQARARFPLEDAAWRRGEDLPRGGGETYREVGARASEVVDELIAGGELGDGQLALLVLHGGSARALLGSLMGLPAASWYRLGPLGNCRWSLVRSFEGGFRLLEHNVAAEPAATLAIAGPTVP
ncbi:MAG: histidine phosphatase family protein, partial [Frankia sp.]